MFFALGAEIPAHKETAKVARSILVIDHKSGDGTEHDKEPEEIIFKEPKAADMSADVIQQILSVVWSPLL